MKTLLISAGYDKQELEGTWGHHHIRSSLKMISNELFDIHYDAKQPLFRRFLEGDKILETIDEKKPQMVIHAPIDNDLECYVLKKIKEKLKGKLIGIITSEQIFPKETLEYYDEIWVMSKELMKTFELENKKNVKLLPFGSMPNQYYPVESNKTFDVTFVGQANAKRAEYLTYLKENGIRLNIRGLGWEEYPALHSVSKGMLLHYELRETYSSSKIVLGIQYSSQNPEKSIFAPNAFEVAACKGFFLTNKNEELEAFFTDQIDIKTYTTKEELLNLIHHYLNHESERKMISERAFKKATQKEYTLVHSMAKLLDTTPLESHTDSKKVEPVKRPRISVISYVYNLGKYLEELIHSVRSQTYTDFEFLILDDGSTDNTKEIVEKHLEDKRIKYVYQENVCKQFYGFDKLIKRSLELTTGELVTFIGGDDIMHQQRLEIQSRDFEENQDLDISFCEANIINENGDVVARGIPPTFYETLNDKNFLRELFELNFIAHPTAILKRNSILKAGGFQTEFASDYYFWLITASRFNYNYIPEVLVSYRKHSESASLKQYSPMTKFTNELLHKMRKYYTIVDLFPELELCASAKEFSRAYTHLGNRWLKSKHHQKELAIMDYKKSLSHDPYNLQALNNLLVTYGMEHQFENAMKLEKNILEALDKTHENNTDPEIIDAAKKNLVIIKEVVSKNKKTIDENQQLQLAI